MEREKERWRKRERGQKGDREGGRDREGWKRSEKEREKEGGYKEQIRRDKCARYCFVSPLNYLT